MVGTRSSSLVLANGATSVESVPSSLPRSSEKLNSLQLLETHLKEASACSLQKSSHEGDQLSLALNFSITVCESSRRALGTVKTTNHTNLEYECTSE